MLLWPFFFGVLNVFNQVFHKGHEARYDWKQQERIALENLREDLKVTLKHQQYLLNHV